MVKAGLIAGACMFLFVLLSASIVSPLCALCVPLVTGLLAGYLTGVFEKPASSQVAKRSALAGAIAGGLAIPAGLIVGVINAIVIQDPNNQVVNQFLDIAPTDPTAIWIGQITINLCVGALNVGLAALLGMAGGAIWSNTAGKG